MLAEMPQQIRVRGHLVFSLLAPGIQQDDPVAELLHIVQQVGRKYDTGFAAQTAEQPADLFGLQRIQTGGGFVEDQDIRSMHQGLGQPKTLRHAGRESAREPPIELGQPDLVEDGVDRVDQPLSREATQAARPLQVLTHREFGIERHPLRQKTDMPAQCRSGLVESLLQDKYLAARGGEDSGKQLHKGGFAGAIDAEQPEAVAGLELQVEVTQAWSVGIAVAELSGEQNGFHVASDYRARPQLRTLKIGQCEFLRTIGRMMRLGVDTGGTFTDFVLLDSAGQLRVHKVLSTPDAPERAILQGIEDMGLDRSSLQLVHGSTVATNAVLEGKGVKTLYVANRGFADLLNIGRQQRAALYDLQPPGLPPTVPPDQCLETAGRLDADGQLLEPLDEAGLRSLVEEIRRHAPEAVAVNLLFSYLDSGTEERIAAAIPDGVFVSLSSSVLPEIREYERGMATWLNAWIGPRVAGYLACLADGLEGVSVSVMQSSGDTVAAAQAAGNAVRMLLSGPAGGLIAARHVGAGKSLLTFDMGGTSTDVALVDAETRLTTEGRIGRFPVAVPMVDMHTIGAGGGSIAWLDAGGMLQVGPESAGAAPGPACYASGGLLPTVTDANLVLGRLPPEAFLGGEMHLDEKAAMTAIAALAERMRSDVVQTARDIVDVANEHMAQALRAISIKRGADPRERILASFGGAGGLHVCELAERLDMTEAMVPVHGGVLSALGMLVARPGRQLSRTLIGLLHDLPMDEVELILSELRGLGLDALQGEGFDPGDCDALASVDLRYAGQSYTLNLPWRGVAATSEDFHRRHQQRYGHRLELPVELVNLRQWVRGPETELELPQLPRLPPAKPFDRCVVAGMKSPVPQYWRRDLVAGQTLEGPALVCEEVATSWIAPGWSMSVDAVGNLVFHAGSSVTHRASLMS